MKILHSSLLLVLFLAGYLSGQSPFAAPCKPLSLSVFIIVGVAFVATPLRAGGFILYFRHADTDQTQRDARTGNVDDCASQRNLSDRGREHARAIGETIRALGIPIGAVLASPLLVPQDGDAAAGQPISQVAERLVRPDRLVAVVRPGAVRRPKSWRWAGTIPVVAGPATACGSFRRNCRSAAAGAGGSPAWS